MKRRSFAALVCYIAPMILGLHFIFSAYGFWLPNDPRGSWSEVVRQFELARFGSATKVNTTSSVAASPHDYANRLAAKQALKYLPVRFTGKQAQAIAKGFALACNEADYYPLALAIMPDHVHLLLERHPRHVDQIASHLKAKATQVMNQAGLHPMARYPLSSGRLPSPWARKYWCPFVDDERYMQAAICYIEENPLKAGLRRQRWSFVKTYRG